MNNRKEYNKQYYQKHKKELREYQKKWHDKNKEDLNLYSKKYYQEHKEKLKECNKRWRQEHKEQFIKYQKKWNKNNPEYAKKYYQEHELKQIKYKKDWREQKKIKVFNIISNNNPHCVRCGCDDIRLLIIHHKDGGGNKEIRGGKTNIFYNDILNGKRKTDDLEIFCGICHTYYHYELKFGKLPYNIFYYKK